MFKRKHAQNIRGTCVTQTNFENYYFEKIRRIFGKIRRSIDKRYHWYLVRVIIETDFLID